MKRIIAVLLFASLRLPGQIVIPPGGGQPISVSNSWLYANKAGIGARCASGQSIVQLTLAGGVCAPNSVAGAAGISGQLQVNLSGALAGLTVNGDAVLNGTNGVLTVVRMQGRTISSTAPNNGYALVWNSGTSQWEPQAQVAVSQPGGSVNQVQWNQAGAFGGFTFTRDVTLVPSTGAATVIGLQGRDVATTAPTNGYALVWNSGTSKWEPQAQSGSGSTGDPGGSSPQIQWNNSGVFDGFTASGDALIVPSTGVVTVKGLQGRTVVSTAPSNLQYLGWNSGSSQWEPKTLPAPAPGGSSAQIQWNNGGSLGGFTASGDALIVPSTGVITVQGLQGRALAATAPTNGYALVWNSGTSQWEPQVQAGAGSTGLPGGSGGQVQINNAGTFGGITFAQDVTLDTSTGNATVQGLRGRSVGSAAPSDLQYLGWNNGATRWEPKTLPIGGSGGQVQWNNGGILGGFTFSGDLTVVTSTGVGTVQGLQGRSLSTASPTDTQALTWSASTSKWTPTSLLTTQVAEGTNLYFTNARVRAALSATSPILFDSSTGIISAPTVITSSTVADTDLSGTFPHLTVAKIRNRTVAATAPTGGQVLTWNAVSTQWEPQTPAAGITPGGSSGQIQWNNAGILAGLTFSGDVLLSTSGAATVQGLQGRSVAATAPADTQVLTWSASAGKWQPANAAGGGGSAGNSNQLNDWRVTWTDSSHLAIACSTGCNVSLPGHGTVTFAAGSFPLTILGTGGSGSGTLYIGIDAVTAQLVVGHNVGSFLVSGSGFTSTNSGVTSFGTLPTVPGGALIPLWTWPISSGAFASTGGVDERAFLTAPLTSTTLPGEAGNDFAITIGTSSVANDTVIVAPGNYFNYFQTNSCQFKLTTGNHTGIIDIWFNPSGNIVAQWTQQGTNALSLTGTTTNCAQSGVSTPAFPLDWSRWLGSVNIKNNGTFDTAAIVQYAPSAGTPMLTFGTGLSATPTGSTLAVAVDSTVLRNNSTNTAAAGMTLDNKLATSTRPSAVGTFAAITAAITCGAGTIGYEAWITDSTTQTWGATVTGGSSSVAKMGCDGTNWTVIGK